MTLSRIWTPTARMHVARAGVGLAAVFGLLGQLITFYPGAEAGWFGAAAGVALVGLVSPTWKLRLVAVFLAVVLAGSAWGGYVRGRQYRERLSGVYHRPWESASRWRALDLRMATHVPKLT